MQMLDKPFPHVIAKNFYNEKELELIKEELKFLTYPGKLLMPGIHHGSGGLGGLTESKALHLEEAYKIPDISNILKVTQKTFDAPFVTAVVNKWPSFLKLKHIDFTMTKVRYYHNGEGYEPHIDVRRDFLTFSYFHTTPKKFTGGEVYFPKYDYEVDCTDNTFILLPGYVEHAVRTTLIDNDDYWKGNGRYCVSQFLNVKVREKYGTGT